jgi:predicted nucleotidyltransferase
MKPSQKLAEHRSELLKLAHDYRIRDVKVFGSVAHGHDREGSDIDLLVEMEPGASLFDLSGFGLDAEELLGVRLDIVSNGRQVGIVMDRIRAEAVPL